MMTPCRKIREGLGITQEEIAVQIHEYTKKPISLGAISHYETGKRRPKDKVAEFYEKKSYETDQRFSFKEIVFNKDIY